jgi:hypothetical protein
MAIKINNNSNSKSDNNGEHFNIMWFKMADF